MLRDREGAATEQSTHSAVTSGGGFKMHEMQQEVRRGRHVFMHLEEPAAGHVLTSTEKILLMNGQFSHDC